MNMTIMMLGVLLLTTLGCEDTDACDEPDFSWICEDDPYVAGGDPGDYPDVRLRYNILFIFDEGSMDDGAGTTGVDICAVSADCAQVIGVTPYPGGGTLCAAEGEGCPTDRTDRDALDRGDTCEADSVPSDYVSLGTDGHLLVGFDDDLQGCTITVVELVDAAPEAYAVYVCAGWDVATADCLNRNRAIHTAFEGGTATFTVPAE